VVLLKHVLISHPGMKSGSMLQIESSTLKCYRAFSRVSVEFNTNVSEVTYVSIMWVGAVKAHTPSV
jgi:hypothetical protein